MNKKDILIHRALREICRTIEGLGLREYGYLEETIDDIWQAMEEEDES